MPYPFYTIKKMPLVTATQELSHKFGFISLHTVLKLRGLPLLVVNVSLHYLPKVPAFNSHMRQNAYHRNLK